MVLDTKYLLGRLSLVPFYYADYNHGIWLPTSCVSREEKENNIFVVYIWTFWLWRMRYIYRCCLSVLIDLVFELLQLIFLPSPACASPGQQPSKVLKLDRIEVSLSQNTGSCYEVEGWPRPRLHHHTPRVFNFTGMIHASLIHVETNDKHFQGSYFVQVQHTRGMLYKAHEVQNKVLVLDTHFGTSCLSTEIPPCWSIPRKGSRSAFMVCLMDTA